MLRAALLLAVCLLLLSLPVSSFAQQSSVVAAVPVDPLVVQTELRGRIDQLARKERELKLAGQPRGFRAQLITAAALGGAGAITGAAALTTALVSWQCDCGPSVQRTRRLTIAGYAMVGVAGIWAITLTSIRRARTDRVEVRRLHEERRGLQQEYRRVRRGYPTTPITFSLLLAPRLLGLRASY
jgi:4-amino-4-deoxy-L-arabinose transferase-like glycosyltransferase